MNGLFEKQKRFLMPTYSPQVSLTRGEGSFLWDGDGRRYLDFGSGISVCNLGHCHPKVSQAIAEQAETLVHVSNLYYNEKQPVLADKLITRGFDGACFFANSGAEANEGMIKLARKWGEGFDKKKIVVMENSFHGRTLATLAATGQKKYRAGFAPDMPGFKHVPFNDLNALAQEVDDRTCAVMLEPVQGEGGVIPADQNYLEGVRKLCDDRKMLLLFDEVQCGMGRTGAFFAWQRYGVEPDVLTLAKALGNGFPIGAVVAKRAVSDVLSAGTHASTFGGNPLACAAAIAVLDAFAEENVLDNCNEVGAYLVDKLMELKERHPQISEIRGVGLMIGVVLDSNELPKAIMSEAARCGLLVLTAGSDVVRLLPPLTVSRGEVDEAVTILDSVFQSL